MPEKSKNGKRIFVRNEGITLLYVKEKPRNPLLDVVENYGGLEKGLPELFGYIGIVKEFKHIISSDKTQNILFDISNGKQIKIPEIILTR